MKTNYEKIKNMSIEETAEFINEIYDTGRDEDVCFGDVFSNGICVDNYCKSHIMKYLQQQAE